METCRLFVAVELPDGVHRSLARLQTGVPGMRWADPEQMHLTLRFIGEVPAEQLDVVRAALRNVQAPPFTLRLQGIGFFAKRPQAVLWTGVETSEALLHLKQQVDAALAQTAGIPQESGTYRPHITLGRMKQTNRRHLEQFQAAHIDAICQDIPVTSFTLFRSNLSPSGAIHFPEARYPLPPF